MAPPAIVEMMSQAGSAIAGLMVAYAMFQNYFPYQLRRPVTRYIQKLIDFINPHLTITFPEFQQGQRFGRSMAYTAIERYLNANSTKQAKRLYASVARDSEALVLTMGSHQQVIDDYKGVKLHWSSSQSKPQTQSVSFYPQDDEKRFFHVKFHKKHRNIVIESYLKHVLEEGKAITVKERKRKLYTNNKNEGWRSPKSMWSHIVFDHPASFNTLAMDPAKKQEIVDDLITFAKAQDYYAKIGKAWKRGYLLYGPPGTGKSTMIAAIANLLKYDIYDLELTSVKDNTELRKLLIDTTSKAVIVIEDIDCSLDLTGQREKKKDNEEEKKSKDVDAIVKEKMKKLEEAKSSQVTLSGLLNFIDGLWSACGSERIIIFTTNYIEKLDPALIRRGRMDKHIELSYCGFEAFRALVKNYLDIDSHELFGTVKQLLEEINTTPADVAENLMPKSGGEDAETCLVRLVKALEEAKEEAKKKVEEEEKLKAEKLAKEQEEEKKAKGKVVKLDIGKQDLSNEVKENGELSEAQSEN